MSLKDKLARLPYLSAQRMALPQKPLGGAALASSHDLPGKCRAGDGGVVQVVEQAFDLHSTHGRVAIGSALAASPMHLARAAFDATLEQVDLRNMVFLDTETTGLMGGTGTLACVIGMAWFDVDAQVLRMQQYILPGPGQEAPMLRAVHARLATAGCLVTFNGKAFDWPLLRNRFILNRIVPIHVGQGPRGEREASQGIPHLDLLHCARRMFKRRLGSVRLTTLEQHVLGLHRVDDVAGALIPELYFAYLRHGDGSTLRPVVEHNALDVLALAALVGVVSARMGDVFADDPLEDRLSIARCWARHRDMSRTAQWVQSMPEDVEALWLMAQTYHVHGNHNDAIGILERALAHVAKTPSAEADHWAGRIHLKLAKWYEHRIGDLQHAMMHAQHLSVQDTEGAALHSKRVQRLHQRIKRRAAKST